jgi:iron uptake system component EfeO
MRMRAALATALVLALVAAACGDDSSPASSSASGSASSSASASASGLSLEELEGGTDDPLVRDAVVEYTAYVDAQVDELIAATTTFTDAVRAGDLAAAQDAYARSRVAWERIEPIAGLIEDIDGRVDSRVDDFAGEDDAGFTGWHRLEYLLFEQQTTEGGAEFADRLDADLAELQSGLADLEIPPAAVAVGAAELVEEVSEGKITGEEDRYSKTDLWDFAANLEGARAVIVILTPALEAADPELLGNITDGLDELDATLAPLRDGDSWVLYCLEGDEFPSDRCPDEPTVDAGTVDLLKAQLAGLSEHISLTAGALGLS